MVFDKMAAILSKTIRNPTTILKPDMVGHLKTGHVRFSDPHSIWMVATIQIPE